jgi:hypothetical protein
VSSNKTNFSGEEPHKDEKENDIIEQLKGLKGEEVIE